MSREDRLAETFVIVSDTLVDDFDLIDFLQMLAERCVDLFDVTAAGIMIGDARGQLRHAACSDERMRLVELFELQVDEGPCLDAYRSQTAVVCGSAEEAAARWPRFAPSVLEHGFAAVAGVPMRLRAHNIGALNLFSCEPGALNETDLRLVQALADVATIGILQERAIRDRNVLATQLEGALLSRVAIEQAKGVVAENANINVDESFRLIRNFARSNNRRLTEVAQALVDGSLSVKVLSDAPQPPASR
jgi:GAF domain-containing protein